ncbi:MAG: 5-nucleotidase [Propionibacteriaceae bacterium]|nr:5-nucleotidase [Propionibacteriaceae bacterium]
MPIRRWTKGAATGVALALAGGSLASLPTLAHAAAALPIAAIQGTTDVTPYLGKEVTTTPSMVTAVYGQGSSSELRGFVVQTPGSGGRKNLTKASDAVFVFMNDAAFDVAIGDVVTVRGTAGEFNGLTQIAGQVTVTDVPGTFAPVKPVTGRSWRSTVVHRENLESMLFESSEKFLVSDTFPLLRFGELGLSSGDSLPVQPTEVGPANSSEARAQAVRNAAIRVNLDDGSNRGYTRTKTLPARTLPYLTANKNVTVGDRLTLDEPVVVDFRNGLWKFNPTRPISAGDEVATVKPKRAPKVPKVGGAFSVASFNVLNYFTTTGDGRKGCTGSNLDTADSFNITFDCDVRGAWDAADLTRQQDKITSAINKLNASVVGLMEIENSVKLGEPADEATATLVGALNRAAGERRWAYVRSSTQLQSVADQDFITNALIYRIDKVKLNGKAYALGAEAGEDGAFANARTPIAASFTARSGGKPMLVVVNHLKSKSGQGTGDNADTGEGAFNGDRVRQAQALVEWLPDVQAASRADATILVGDFNSYTAERPLQVLYRAGYRNAAPGSQYSYSFSGLAGSLDHILVNRDARKRLTRSTVWNINSGESPALEYSTYKTTKVNYYRSDPTRSSDHDPVVAGFRRGPKTGETDLTLLNFNDFHGRIDDTSPNTVGFFGTIEEERELAGEKKTLLLSAGDSIGGSLFTSSVQQDQPTIDILNAADLSTSAVGNHEFDKGFSDLTGRVADAADWTYLGANVYAKGTTKPALPEYALFKRSGLSVAVVGAVTDEVPSLVSAAGVADIDFGDPVDAVNRVAKKLSDGKKSNGEADVIVAEYHEGAVEGQGSSTLADQVAKGGMFAKIVEKTSPDVDAIFTAHTHQAYAWDGPIPGHADRTRPILQAESYAALLGKVTLTIDKRSGDVVAYDHENLKATSTSNADLVAAYPRVKTISGLVDAALAKAAEVGDVVIGEASAPITRAFSTNAAGEKIEDRAAESTIGNLVANMLRDQLADPARGGAQIGVQNPGGNRADLDRGDITFGEAASVLPFANSLFTETLTGAQFKTLLEQQWQTNRDGSPFTGSRPYLQLGLSDNVSYTFDASRPWGSRITSISIDGKPIDPAQNYRVAIPSFLTTGGDNFHVLRDGTDKRDSGLIDLDSWTDYVKSNVPLTPSFAKQAVSVVPLPSTLAAGGTTTFDVSGLDFTSDGSPATTSLAASLNGSEIGTFPVSNAAARVDLAVPSDAPSGPGTLVLTGNTGTTVRIPVTVE